MEPSTAKTIVLASTGIMLVLVATDATSTRTRVQRVWPVAVVSLGLSVLTDVAPQVAGPAAILVLLAVAGRQRGWFSGVLGGVSPVSKPTTSK